MNQHGAIRGFARKVRRGNRRPGACLAAAVTLSAMGIAADADTILPTFGPAVYNIAIANPAINGGTPASTASADNAIAINAYLTYCSTHGGGTVEIPAGTFLSSTLTMQSNVNLQLDTSAILRDTATTNTLLKCSSGSNMAISGSGAIDGAATTTVGSANLVDLRGVNTLAITGVSILNSAHEHLVPINDSNVTISNITIADPGTLAANMGNYLANTDAIDYAGNNFLIKNCNINCGDDDIVAKPASFACTNILITNCTIGAGHGISVGGGSAQGVSNLLVTHCSLTGTDNGLRLKAQDAAGGDAGGGTAHPLVGITFSDITMTNVANPIVIDSFYNGNNNFPASPTDSTHYPVSPIAADATTPIWNNITFDNITATGCSNAGLIYGLNTSPLNLAGLSFNNVSIAASSHMNLWYASNVNLSGLTVTIPSSDPYANASPVHGVFLSNSTQAAATSLHWTGKTDGATWNFSSQNWQGSSSYLDPDTVTFDDTATASARSIVLPYAVSPSSITFNSSASTYTLGGSGAIIGPGSLINSGTGLITVNVLMTLTGNATINAGTILLAAHGNSLGQITGSGTLTVNGDLTAASVQLNNLTVNGQMTLRPGSTVNRLTTLSLGGAAPVWTGQLDLTTNSLIVASGAGSANIPHQIGQAANLGQWNAPGGGGITSSSALAAATSSTATALGYATGTEFTAATGQTTFSGQPFNPTDTLIMYTLAGDATMDGSVTFADFLALQNNYNQPGDWSQGDFNYDGQVTFADFLILQNNYNKTLPASPILPALSTQSSALSTSSAPAPEPATLLLAAFALPLLTGRRSRWRRAPR